MVKPVQDLLDNGLVMDAFRRREPIEEWKQNDEQKRANYAIQGKPLMQMKQGTPFAWLVGTGLINCVCSRTEHIGTDITYYSVGT